MAASTIGCGVSLALSQRRKVASVSVGGASGASEAPPSPSAVASSSSSDPQAANKSEPASPIAASVLTFTSSLHNVGRRAPRPVAFSCDTQFSIEKQHRCAEEDVGLPERAEPDVEVVAARRHCPLTDGVEGRRPEQLVEQVEGTGEHDLPQVEGADHRGERLTQPPAAVLPLAIVGATQAGGRPPGGLEAADPATCTGRAVGVDHHVADLAGREAVAHHEVAVEDQPGADAVADLDQEEAALRGPTQPELAERGGVGVVGDVDGDGERLRQAGGQVGVVPAQVGCFEDNAGGVDHAGAADADAQEGAGGGAGEVDTERGGQLERGGGSPAVPRRRPAVEDLAAEVDEGGGEAGVIAG